ncbi:hypothetical protein JBL43_10690 [Aureibaculum sp. A20]|uniref:Uncharacterized protein n=1 Tax=Aureibaculum flavum TaxID=2795986 RepID=A0ABS0WRT9_9FLAO|nr:hypothetical protein [Aureibaculum flavum]MBJ2174705.1 hypothetical protein [Aureibaculum flavum]
MQLDRNFYFACYISDFMVLIWDPTFLTILFTLFARQYKQYDMEIDSLQKQIFQITTDDKPEFFLLELLKKSANY